MTNKYSRLRKKNSGAVLLEVLISTLLFSFGVLGLVGMQAVATQNSINSQDRAVASILANDMVSQMWAKKTSTIASVAISGDITAWKLKVQNSILSNAAGDVTEVAGLATVTVTWKAPTKLGTDNASKYETSVFVQ
ncbi:MAG: hypothetical protein Q8M45_06155 [Methylotenera sp.]|nr:hypothetical protein [Methylotenera sp.]MDP1755366.1 hypothetical protein [Methylotenera sp.]MDP1959631.1 hypothetical protein [Methylotenera sp.]MDP3207484.1 hypothetical protein [Methylotenera sp.]MDP3943227.1 hypothetical protein [Methylotenera sp.]